MWIRDELPQRLPGVRFMIHGYDTALRGSTSFQTIPDLAISLVHTLKAIGWSAPSAKPVLFLAHSLGGVVLKQALVNLAGGGNHERAIFGKVKGAIFFGVPSQGMSMPDIFEMLEDQPNKALVKDLSDHSDFLPKLDEQFGNISYLQRLQFFWAFETKVTPIVEKTLRPGNFARTGPGTVMVSRESATRNLCHLQPSSTIQIDENHSDMVKFGIGDHYIDILASTLKSICAPCETAIPQLSLELIRNPTQRAPPNPTLPSNPRKNNSDSHAPRRSNLQPEWTAPGFWSDDVILSSLRAPERDRRLEQINQKLGDTFNWAFDDVSVGLNKWLQKGTGIFWINGKPASGKSTLMKYLYQDPRTKELLRASGWQSRARLTTASFFFHHRGNNMQKSFEGLLRSLISQILEQEKILFRLLYPILVGQYRTEIASSGLDSLEKDIWDLLDHFEVPYSSRVASEVRKTVTSQRALTESRQLGIHLKRMLKGLNAKLYLEPQGRSEEVDLDDIQTILSTVIEPESGWPEPTNWVAVLVKTLQRHYRREKIRMDIQARPWSRESLDDGLRRLIGQSLFKMDLFFFLDALDEYNGRPEFIASFLQDLVQQPAEPSKRSSTRIRILFSSRPWKTLSDEFAACPGFQIHDYTGNDILEFCAASIPSNETAKEFLSPFVNEIVRRARGVFLWVELVMRDLTKIVAERVQLSDVQGLEEELRKTLDGIPDELDDYYQLIVQRIPSGTRRESYVVLETLCRSDQDIDMMTLRAILECSYSKSLADAQNRLKGNSKVSLHGPGPEWGETYIKVVSGGLVEVSGLSHEGKPIVQFMHQTVKQFVLSPRFKLQLFGDNVGMFVIENGHSFISKHLFIDPLFDDRFFYHAREAEITTGFSQYDFFSTAPRDHYSFVHRRFPLFFPSMIAVAVLAGLQLYISDAYEADRRCIQRNSAKLLPLLVDADMKRKKGQNIDVTIKMAEVLVAKGLSIDESDYGLWQIIQRMWQPDHGAGLHLIPEYGRLAVILADAIARPRASTELSSFLPMSTQSATTPRSNSVTELLHRGTPQLVRALLSRGFNPNSLHDENTPIDTVLAGKYLYSPNPRENLLHQYDIISQLVCDRGVLCSTRRSRWNEWESVCAASGLDIEVFQEAGFPLWHSRTRRAMHFRSLRRYIPRLTQF